MRAGRGGTKRERERERESTNRKREQNKTNTTGERRRGKRTQQRKRNVNGWLVGLSKPVAIGCCGFWPYWIGGLASVVPQ